jgi:hypothetical protein
VFPARYELNSYIVFRKRLVSKRLKLSQLVLALEERRVRSRSVIHYRQNPLDFASIVIVLGVLQEACFQGPY